MDRYNLFCGDCLEIMPSLEESSVDMVLCDLPYGTTRNAWDSIIPFDSLWKQYGRITKDNGAILLFGQGQFSAGLVMSNPKMFRYDIIWNKELSTGFLNAHKMPLRTHEHICVFYNELPIYNPQMTNGAPLHSVGKQRGGEVKKNYNYGNHKIADDSRCGCTEKYPKSVISIQKPHPSVCVHPTQKPVALLEYLIKTYTNEGGVVLDNCMGSGSTGVACVNTRRRFVGIENNEEYFNIATKRIIQAEEQYQEFCAQGWDKKCYSHKEQTPQLLQACIPGQMKLRF